MSLALLLTIINVLCSQGTAMSEKHINISTHQFCDLKCHDYFISDFDLKILLIHNMSHSLESTHCLCWPWIHFSNGSFWRLKKQLVLRRIMLWCRLIGKVVNNFVRALPVSFKDFRLGFYILQSFLSKSSRTHSSARTVFAFSDCLKEYEGPATSRTGMAPGWRL